MIMNANSPAILSLYTSDEREFATFFVGNLYLGVDIRRIHEIIRQVRITRVPHAPDCIRGVINLRGDVVTIADLRAILKLAPSETDGKPICLIVGWEGERVGLLADRVGDVVRVSEANMDRAPLNLGNVDGRFFSNVVQLDSQLLVILNVDEALAVQVPQA
jgi:purine-binding chemotaxis protein CheW